jgi:hypothetical protein
MAVRKKLSLTMFVNIEIVLFFTRKSS